MGEASHLRVSNFLAYARNHAIMALSSSNYGTEEVSRSKVCRNIFRLFVDSHECASAAAKEDVPIVMGFAANRTTETDDRPIVLYAGSLSCISAKMSAFCRSSANLNARVCDQFKQTFLSTAADVYSRLLRANARRLEHEKNYNRAARARGGTMSYPYADFQRNLVSLQDGYIEFLQTLVIGLMMESGGDVRSIPFDLLHARNLEVNDDVGDDYMSPSDMANPGTLHAMKNMDFSSENGLTRQQLAILALLPPNHRLLGTLHVRSNLPTDVQDLRHIQKEIQKNTITSNADVVKKYANALQTASFATQVLEREGSGVDFGIDVADPGQFDADLLRNPVEEAARIPKRFTAPRRVSSSSPFSSDADRKGVRAIADQRNENLQAALDNVRRQVEEEYQRKGGQATRLSILRNTNPIPMISEILRKEYRGT